MDLFIYIFLFILGICLGSFLDVVGNRLPKNESIVKPRSHCEFCNKKLKWYELIPVFSYIFQKGKCRKCKHKLPISYIIVELLTGLLFVVSFYAHGLSMNFYLSCIISMMVVVIYVSDLRYYIILDEVLIIGGLSLFMVRVLFEGFKEASIYLLAGAVLFFIMLLFKLIGDKMFKQESLGGGDIKLAIIIGLTLGLKIGLVSIVGGCFLAFPYAIYLTTRRKEKEVPFGPFLISSTYIFIIYYDVAERLINYLFYLE